MKEVFLPIIYSGFFDAPLAFLVQYNNIVYLFWRGYFDDELDDFHDEYEVFPTQLSTLEDTSLNWDALWKQGRELGCVGKIHMNNVLFDTTRREYISIDTFNKLPLD